MRFTRPVPHNKRYLKIAASWACLAMLATIGSDVRIVNPAQPPIAVVRISTDGMIRLLQRDDWKYIATVVFLTSGTTWATPGDWNNANNTVECIGAGSGGTTGFFDGGGGAYAKASNITISGTISIRVPAGGAVDAHPLSCFFKDTSTVNAVSADGGSGGQASASTGTTKFDGGGGNQISGIGAGGAAGPNGAGQDGFSDKGGDNSGAGDAGSGGASRAAASPGNGNPGQEYDSTHGSGGGAIGTSKLGGLYGGGGTLPAGTGAQALIIVTYTPAGSGPRQKILKVSQAITRASYW